MSPFTTGADKNGDASSGVMVYIGRRGPRNEEKFSAAAFREEFAAAQGRPRGRPGGGSLPLPRLLGGGAWPDDAHADRLVVLQLQLHERRVNHVPHHLPVQRLAAFDVAQD